MHFVKDSWVICSFTNQVYFTCRYFLKTWQMFTSAEERIAWEIFVYCLFIRCSWYLYVIQDFFWFYAFWYELELCVILDEHSF